jgi:hypothetical protein
VLIKRSLFIEVTKGSVQLHDIVRDYILAQSKDLQSMQKEFVKQFMTSQDAWQQVDGEIIPKGRELDWFISSGALTYHMSSAWSKPLASDEQACGWLLSQSDMVKKNAVNAIGFGDMIGLAKSYTSSSENKKASQVCSVLLTCRALSTAQGIECARLQLAVGFEVVFVNNCNS